MFLIYGFSSEIYGSVVEYMASCFCFFSLQLMFLKLFKNNHNQNLEMFVLMRVHMLQFFMCAIL